MYADSCNSCSPTAILTIAIAAGKATVRLETGNKHIDF